MRIHCDQCELMTINGVICHETGCPNDWINPATGQGFETECVWCGGVFTPVFRGEKCCCNDCAHTYFD